VAALVAAPAAPAADRGRGAPAVVRLDANYIENPQALAPFFARLRVLKERGQGRVAVLHLGDSHVFADYMTGELRRRYQAAFGSAGRGIVTPLALASPLPGPLASWERRAVPTKPVQGVGGVNVTWDAWPGGLRIALTKSAPLDYMFERMFVFFHQDYGDPGIRFCTGGVCNGILGLRRELTGDCFAEMGQLPAATDDVTFVCNSTESPALCGEIYAVDLENGRPGVLYHSVGVNGASVVSYLGSPFLRSVVLGLQPALVVVSLGTNDATRVDFGPAKFADDLTRLAAELREAAPDAPLLFTTPPDSYPPEAGGRRGSSRRVAVAAGVVREAASALEAGVWDLHEVMGGFGSIDGWAEDGYVRPDHIHFAKPGYEIQAGLLYDALDEAYRASRRK
jgi:lysophospholipase L1-like esterase